ncbi:MAG: ABC transporter ATP-binding protein [Sphingobacteriales bacterium]|nr:MAG: ABC transporter ATP-binding protein [Sphingobacteriales bacterium]
MAENILEIENLSKMYKLGEINTGSLSTDIQRWFSKITNKPDAYEKLIEVNDRETKGESKYVWSLKDVNFNVKQGEVFGIIGKNGAGKSTLLKLLSKITKPTQGSIKVGGRIASLLEVGTGFHPDLSGRDNIYLNGAILGMRKHEITAKLDEIVDFSGIERYIDTPVKRYSSGMFVRLAFAVAAHLEPDILILDEVLAVGDAEFQKKCLAKMEDVSKKHGRTVLFVSHNIAAVKQLCTKAMLLENGMVKHVGSVESTLEIYQETDKDHENGIRNIAAANEKGYFTSWKITGQSVQDEHSCITGEAVNFVFSFNCVSRITVCQVFIRIMYDDDRILLIANSKDYSNNYFDLEPGNYSMNFKATLPIKTGKYGVQVALVSQYVAVDAWESNTKLTVLDNFNVSGLHVNEGILNIRTGFNYQPSNSFV